MKKIILLAFAILTLLPAGADKAYKLTSPDGKLSVGVNVGQKITYTLQQGSQKLISPSAVSMKIAGGKTWGENSKLKKASTQKHNGTILAVCYKKDKVSDNYNELTLQFGEGFNLIFRAYDEGMAYRFQSTLKKPFIVENEGAQFCMAQDWESLVPYSNGDGNKDEQVYNSFESTNQHCKLSALNADKIAFTPVLIKADNGVKMVIGEADMESYPGMFLTGGNGSKLTGFFAKVPQDVVQAGHNNLEYIVKTRKNYIAEVKGARNFPWRFVTVSTQDKQLLDNDMVYRLATPNKIGDTSWIKPGKVAWDWWNNWGVYNVPFKAGVNTETYKYYIDFASQKGIEYVILDEGWAVNKKADLMQVIPEIDLKEIISYAKQKNVGIILWAGAYAFGRDMEGICKHYSAMGVKGFKVDFLNRDDQKMVDFHYDVARIAAKYHMLIDFHGTYKPTGLNRTYPNVLNFEGIAGLEQNKWSTIERYDHVQFDTEIPFTRMLSGQMDYTQGAMLNGGKKEYHASNALPMSQGTRCHQLGEYMVFFSPLNMLCDSPTHYLKEPECTDFIASIPVVWDETLPLNSKVGEYVTVARRNGSKWYVGGITNWDDRDLTLDLNAIQAGGKKAELFRDGPNVKKFPQDFLKEEITIPADGKLNIHMASGGGFALKIK